MGTYVIGDIHGCFDKWLRLKYIIESKDKDAKFIFVGDIIDRGRQTMEMLNWAMENVKPGGKYQMVLGNHEYMKVLWARQYNKYDLSDKENSKLYKNFVDDYYHFNYFLTLYDVTDDFVLKAIRFMANLPLYIELDVDTFGRKQHYVVCHSAMPEMVFDEHGRVIDSQTKLVGQAECEGNSIKNYIIEYRNYFGNHWDFNTILVHGHTPTFNDSIMNTFEEEGLIDFKAKDINVDCGAVFNSSLAAIRLEDLEEFYDTGISRTKNHKYKERMMHLLKTGNEYDISIYKDKC